MQLMTAGITHKQPRGTGITIAYLGFSTWCARDYTVSKGLAGGTSVLFSTCIFLGGHLRNASFQV